MSNLKNATLYCHRNGRLSDAGQELTLPEQLLYNMSVLDEASRQQFADQLQEKLRITHYILSAHQKGNRTADETELFQFKRATGSG